MIGAGVATAVFWLMVLPFESFAGPAAPLHPLFAPSQVVHIVGAILAVFGYTGLYLHQQEKTGWLGLIGYAIAVVGAIFIFGDGIIGLAVFPVLATHAPELTAATGPMFTGRVLGLYIMFFATNMVGIILLDSAAGNSPSGSHTARLECIQQGSIGFNQGLWSGNK